MPTSQQLPHSLAARGSSYPHYKSPYGPKYHFQPQVGGVSIGQLVRFGLKSGYFGAVALGAVIYFVSGVPRVKADIMQKLPYLGDRFVDKTPSSDNPF